MALDIHLPWEIKIIKFQENESRNELHIEIDFKKGSKFQDKDGHFCSVHDTKSKMCSS